MNFKTFDYGLSYAFHFQLQFMAINLSLSYFLVSAGNSMGNNIIMYSTSLNKITLKERYGFTYNLLKMWFSVKMVCINTIDDDNAMFSVFIAMINNNLLKISLLILFYVWLFFLSLRYLALVFSFIFWILRVRIDWYVVLV